MQVTFPRLLGALALIFAVVLQKGALDWTSEGVWLALTTAWIATAALLVSARHQVLAGCALATLCVLLWLGPGRDLDSALALLFWLAIAVALTDERPRERALLVRTTVTAVYAFAALAKLNPSFLAGEQIRAIALDRSQLEWLVPTVSSTWGMLLAWATVATEASLALALWFPRLRRLAAGVGIVVHAIFVLAVHNGTRWDIAYVAVLNFALVVGYLAYFHPHAWREPTAESVPVRAGSSSPRSFRATG